MLSSYDDLLMRLHTAWERRRLAFADLADNSDVPAFVREWFAEVAEDLRLCVRDDLWGVDAVWCQTPDASRRYGREESAREFPTELPVLLLDIETDAADAGAAFLRLANVGARLRVAVVIDAALDLAANLVLDARDSARLGGVVTAETDALIVLLSPENREAPTARAFIVNRVGERELLFP